jgi:hypothetical protein
MKNPRDPLDGRFDKRGRIHNSLAGKACARLIACPMLSFRDGKNANDPAQRAGSLG